MSPRSLKSWFDPIVKTDESEPEAPWVEVDPRGNSHVRRWKRPRTTDHWNGKYATVYGKFFLTFLPLIVLPLIAGFYHPLQRNEHTCHRDAYGRQRCKLTGYYFTFDHVVMITSATYFFLAIILESVLMAKNRLHPWMYITIYSIGTMFPPALFPASNVAFIRTLTWTYAITEWVICASCILHGICVARILVKEKRSARQVEQDAIYAESLYQDDEREAREGELVLIDEETAFEDQFSDDERSRVISPIVKDMVSSEETGDVVEDAASKVQDETSSNN
ncbi:hypothetical protein GLAREA_12820 [Glarea lozoyensis ATCC 20868]|uniref:Uncharacterized protein n=1 Tax=Glarea lozoyensis (strain ATCC 20868 / MF5171) TaxID=1116229 RepID=S3CUK6_GLAL2|nr:uncharacterized protein GLAREA_12820 [Glarea lozoyensis ATCC 20868]EPE30097.1 hypothetical protein GLAREA_12820 [Glarea lozoyensis ATCC 20868]